MSKIICDICGTSYQDTAECCPICGCTRDAAASLLGEDAVLEEIVEETKPKAGRFAPKKKEIFDFDEVNSDPEDEEDEDEDDDYDEEEDEDEAPRHNTLVVILLTVLIAGLLLAAGFIFFRYFLPNMKQEDIASNTTAPVQTTQAPTVATIPCEALSMASATQAVLSPGGNFLINVIPTPVNTTDPILYVSADEAIATVSADGKITAVSEGTTKIFISCGKFSLECDVQVKIEEETVPPTTEAAVIETAATEETVPATEDAGDNGLKPNVILKLKKTDIRLGVYYKFTLELDCDLAQDEVEWTSEHPHIATVDENGVVTAVKYGTTIVTAKYGDQEVQCWVRCV